MIEKYLSAEYFYEKYLNNRKRFKYLLDSYQMNV